MLVSVRICLANIACRAGVESSACDAPRVAAVRSAALPGRHRPSVLRRPRLDQRLLDLALDRPAQPLAQLDEAHEFEDAMVGALGVSLTSWRLRLRRKSVNAKTVVEPAATK